MGAADRIVSINNSTLLEWQWSAIKAPSLGAVRRANGGRPIRVGWPHGGTEGELIYPNQVQLSALIYHGPPMIIGALIHQNPIYA
jgi:hypothetical protein